MYPFQGAGSCDSFLQHVTHKTQAAHLLVRIIHWLMHGDLKMLVGILELLALPSICLATTCVYRIDKKCQSLMYEICSKMKSYYSLSLTYDACHKKIDLFKVKKIGNF